MSTIESAVLSALRDAKLPCAFAFRIAQENAWTPAEVGEEADRLGVRISRCQLGLFGYDVFRQKGIIQELGEVPGDVTVSLRAVDVDGQVPCEALWRIANEHGLPRVVIACAAETLELRVAPCQLGCF
ncbi:hypothetical protein IH601_12380 [Candidatus Bipolaricaulota bacterium]|jgi:hypothetical protein|nr:hypothetical protein [Candidatus Bipolaricaulota bacterium]TFH08538.1 MAG: hypothetical protein E4H08_07615 [Candidatus Atribacteria bacterium]